MNIPNNLSKAACLIVSIYPNGEIGAVVRAESVEIDVTQHTDNGSMLCDLKATCIATGKDMYAIQQITAQMQTSSLMEIAREFNKSNEEIEIPDLEPCQPKPEQKRPKFWEYDKRRCFKPQGFWKRIRSRTW